MSALSRPDFGMQAQGGAAADRQRRIERSRWARVAQSLPVTIRNVPKPPHAS